MTIKQHVEKFVDNCGGIENVRAAVKALKGVKDRKKYLRGIARTDAGTDMVFAAMMLGFVMADIVYSYGDKGELQSREIH